MTENPTMKKALLRLAADEDFLLLHERLTCFNPFSVLKLKGYEIRHLNMFAWLLNPDGSHGMGFDFLGQFALAMADSFDPESETGSHALHLAERLLAGPEHPAVTVEREAESDGKKAVDLQIRCDYLSKTGAETFIIIIENKVYSRQRVNQLKDYLKHAESVARKEPSTTHVIPVYLTLDVDDEPDEEGYCHMTYAQIVEILRKLMAVQRVRKLDGPARSFIGSYLATLEELCCLDTENQELAQKVYAANKDAVKLLQEKAKGSLAVQICRSYEESISYIGKNVDCDIALAGRKFIEEYNRQGSDAKLSELKHDRRNFFFSDGRLLESTGGRDGDWRRGSVCGYFFFLENTDGTAGKLSLKVEAGPFTEAERRQEFMDLLRSKGFAARTSPSYSRLKYGNLPPPAATVKDVSDENELYLAMKGLFDQTTELRGVLHECLAKYKNTKGLQED